MLGGHAQGSSREMIVMEGCADAAVFLFLLRARGAQCLSGVRA